MEAADQGLDAVDLIGAEIGLDEVRDVARRASGSPLGADRFFDHLDRRYGWLRQFTPEVIDAFEFRTGQTDPDLVDAIGVLAELNRTGGRKVPDDAPTGFAARRWQRQIHTDDGTVDRQPAVRPVKASHWSKRTSEGLRTWKSTYASTMAAIAASAEPPSSSPR